MSRRSASARAGGGEELVDHLGDDGAVIGSVTRRVMRRANLLNRAVFIVVADGPRLLAHQRAPWKDIWPSYWDLAPLGEVRYEDDRVREIARVYRAETVGPFTFPDGEVVDSAWVDLADLEAWAAGRSVCPDSAAIIPPLLTP